MGVSTKNIFCNYLILMYIYHNLLSFILANMKAHLKTPVAVALALGMYMGIVLFIFALIAQRFGYGRIFVSFMSTFYIGYAPTVFGAFVGFLRGFVDAFIG